MAFMPPFAPLVVLMFLGTCFAVVVISLGVVYGLVRGQYAFVKYGLVLTAVGAGLYAALLLVVSLLSHERVLAPGEQEYFCEVDCHVAYSVVGIATTKTLGSLSSPQAARGTYYVVKVKTWFDERTISKRRTKDLPLTPGPRQVAIVDDQGRRYFPSPDALSALEQIAGQTTPLTQPLRPGESYTTSLVFDLPSDARNPRLLITNVGVVTRFLVGHEHSPLHKKIYFALAPQLKLAAADVWTGELLSCHSKPRFLRAGGLARRGFGVFPR